MKTCTTDIKDMIAIESDFASLLRINTSNSFTYQFKIFINQAKIVENNVNKVKISLYPKPLEVEKSLMSSANDPKALVNAILSAQSRRKDIKRNNATSAVYTTIIDVTTALNNEVVKNLNSSTAGKLLPGKKVFAIQSSEELTKNNISVPILQTSTNSNTTSKNISIKDASLNLILSGKDPNANLGRNNNVNKSSSSFAGTTSGKKSLSDADINEQIILNSISNKNIKMPSTSKQLPNGSMVPVLIKMPTLTIPVSKIVDIPSSALVNLLDGSFYAVIEAENIDKEILQSLSAKIDHSNLVKIKKFSSSLPPKISVGIPKTVGKNELVLKRRDDNTSKILLYRKIFKITTSELDNVGFDFIKEILTPNDSDFHIDDLVNNSNAIVYRAIPVNKDGITLSVFSTAVAPAMRMPNGRISNKMSFISIMSDIQLSGINLEIRNIPTDVSAIKILKKDMTLKEKIFSPIDSSEPIKLINGKSLIMFLDTSVKPAHIYEYKCKLIYKDGTETISISSATQEYSPLSINIVNTLTTPPILKRGDQLNNNTGRSSIDVNFNIKSLLPPNKNNIMQDTLTKGGLVDLYSNELKNERSKLNPIITHNIIRKNMTTGETEHYGTFNGEEFSDEEMRKQNDAKPIKSGHEYKYVISTQLNNPETLFNDFRKKVIDPVTQKTHEFSPAKFQNNIVLNRGTIATKASRISQHPQDDFSLGNAGNKQEIIVGTQRTTASIVSANVSNIGTRVNGVNTNIVKWIISGDKSKIDHFIINIERLGIVTFVATSHNISNSNSFEFYDTLDNGEIGNIKYHIIPVFNDLTRGETIKTNEVII